MRKYPASLSFSMSASSFSIWRRALACMSCGGAAVAVAKTDPGLLAQKGIHGLAFRYGIAREFVAEIVEREFEAMRKVRPCC